MQLLGSIYGRQCVTYGVCKRQATLAMNNVFTGRYIFDDSFINRTNQECWSERLYTFSRKKCGTSKELCARVRDQRKTNIYGTYRSSNKTWWRAVSNKPNTMTHKSLCWIALCSQATSHHMSQYWRRFMSPYLSLIHNQLRTLLFMSPNL